jgi:magnesium-transporting ATPase (P-type)
MSNPYDSPKSASRRTESKCFSQKNSKALFSSVLYFSAVVGFYLGLFFAANSVPSAQKYVSTKFFLSLSPLALIYGFVPVAITLPFMMKVEYVSTIWYLAAGLCLFFSAGIAFRFFCGFFTV